jgi:VCBS repeat protein
VVPHYKGYNVSVLLGRGDGTFKGRASYETGHWPSDVAVGRLDRDRYPDLAITNLLDNDVSILLGRGDGTFRRKHDYPAGYEPRSTAIADLNGDGKRDLVIADCAKLSVRKGRGDGTFKRRRVIPMRLALGEVVAGDFTRGDNTDLAASNVAYNSSQGVHVFLGQGNGSFRHPKQYVFDSATTNIEAADLIGHRPEDLVVETEGYPLGGEGPERGWLYVLKGHRDGIFTRDAAQKLDGQGGRFATGDFNGDGKRDIAAITYDPTAKIEIFLNQ